MKQRMTLFMAILLIGIGLSNAQVSQVTGNVMSEEDGLPVVGASVLVKGTTVGTVVWFDKKMMCRILSWEEKPIWCLITVGKIL